MIPQNNNDDGTWECTGDCRGGKGERRLRVKMEVGYIYTHASSTVRPTKHCLKGKEEVEVEWKYNGGGDLVQGTLYPWMELPQ